jgi:hypothetical protein
VAHQRPGVALTHHGGVGDHLVHPHLPKVLTRLMSAAGFTVTAQRVHVLLTPCHDRLKSAVRQVNEPSVCGPPRNMTV